VIAVNEQYKENLFDFFFTIFSTKRLSTPDEITACKLMESILLNLPAQVDSYLYPVLEVIRVRFADEDEYKKPAHKVFLLEVVINAIYYNPVATLNYLEQSNFLEKFIQLWFNEADHFLRVHDKKLSILALMKIVELPSELLPPTLQNDQTLKYLMKAMLTFFQSLPEAMTRTLGALQVLMIRP
jgi:importin-7